MSSLDLSSLLHRLSDQTLLQLPFQLPHPLRSWLLRAQDSQPSRTVRLLTLGHPDNYPLFISQLEESIKQLVPIEARFRLCFLSVFVFVLGSDCFFGLVRICFGSILISVLSLGWV